MTEPDVEEKPVYLRCFICNCRFHATLEWMAAHGQQCRGCQALPQETRESMIARNLRSLNTGIPEHRVNSA